MAQLDIGKAAFSGFGVIGRAKLTPIVWGVVATVLSFLPILLVWPAMAEFFSVVFGSIAAGGQPDQAEIQRLSNQMNVVQPLSWLASLTVLGLVTGAVYRAVLHPEDSRWFYMRFGMGEVMLAASGLVLYILAAIAAFAVMIVAFIVGLILWFVMKEAAIAVGVLLALVGTGVIIWGCLRFGLGLPMSHDRKQFLLFDSWKLTSGHAGGLFVVGLIAGVISWLIMLVLMGTLFGAAAVSILGNGGAEALRALDDTKDFAAFFTPERTGKLIGFGAAYMILGTAIQGYLAAIMSAPWAEAYRQLVPPPAEPA